MSFLSPSAPNIPQNQRHRGWDRPSPQIHCRDDPRKTLGQARCPSSGLSHTWIFFLEGQGESASSSISLGHVSFLPPSRTPPLPSPHRLAPSPLIPADLITPRSPGAPPEDKGCNCLWWCLLTWSHRGVTEPLAALPLPTSVGFP